MTPTPYYQSRGIRIHHGDCLTVMPDLPAESFDLVLTDPPYLVDYIGRYDGKRRAIAGDAAAWVLPAFAEVYRLLKPDTFCVSFYGWPHADVFVSAWKQVGRRPVSHLLCVKNRWGLGRFTRGQHETAYLLAKGKQPPPAKAISTWCWWTGSGSRTPSTRPRSRPTCWPRC